MSVSLITSTYPVFGNQYISRDSNGHLHIVFRKSVSSPYYKLYYGKSVDGGQTWNISLAIDPDWGSSMLHYALGLDSNNNPHILVSFCISGYYYQTIKWYSFDGSSWINNGDINQSIASHSFDYPSFVIDSQDNMHIAYIDLNTSIIYYRFIGSINGSKTFSNPYTFTNASGRHNSLHLLWMQQTIVILLIYITPVPQRIIGCVSLTAMVVIILTGH